MRRLLTSLLLAIALVSATPLPAAATTITITSQTLPNFNWLPRKSGTGVVLLRIYADRPFTQNVSPFTTIQPGSPQSGQTYLQKKCDLSAPDASGNQVLTIPQLTIDSTVDSLDSAGRGARYSAYFFEASSGRLLAVYGGFESFEIPAIFS